MLMRGTLFKSVAAPLSHKTTDLAELKVGLAELCVLIKANYAQFFGELCTQNPELCELCNIFKPKFLMFQFIKLANLLWFYL